MSKIGEALRGARQAAGVKQKDLAVQLGISPTMVNMVETRGTRLPERFYAKLPTAIRRPVIDAAIAELRAKVLALRELR